ncbi:uncharacterized protein BXZ73DRAFT_42858 [Epithele typhae]|uniref:uncharacterized protein n=1 Tax=Epithele typhae TaxID=378194 RepID=UPI002007EE16|nr:uncharacterized protein BXZ73DRAFT_42858 [Epithele typhae]KAH9940383.1 hypothetical protein BXZ73DRAFT_42858 [Epithele typhae]
MSDFLPADTTASPAASPFRCLPPRSPASSPRTPTKPATRPFSSASGTRPRALADDHSAHPPKPSTDKFALGLSLRSGPGHALPPSPAARRSSAARMSCNEVSPATRTTRFGFPIHRPLAHQSGHAPARTSRCPPPLAHLPGPSSFNDPPSLSSSLDSPTPSVLSLPTPHSKRSLTHARTRSALAAPTSLSVSVCSSVLSDCPQWEPSTPSPSPLSHATRSTRLLSHWSPHSRTASSVRRGLLPLPPRPTLAMSMHVYAPSPVLSNGTSPHTARPRSRSRPETASRPSSPLTSSVPLPQRPPMPRPPSRSERLLRDTLRRAEEQERIHNPVPFFSTPASPIAHGHHLPAAAPGGRRHRRATSSSSSSYDHFEDTVDEESPEEDERLWRTNRTVSSPTRPHHKDSVARNPPASPSLARVQLQRSPKTSPSIPTRRLHSQSVSHPAAPARIAADMENMSLTPHEAVLRKRLETMLKTQSRRAGSIERREYDGGLSSGSGDSMSSSRNMSGEGDFFFGPARDLSHTSLSSADRPMPLPSKHHTPRGSHKPASSRKGSSASSNGPLTPPPSPPFNAREAAAQCGAMDGYVSFATIEGLGVPDGSDEEEEDASSRSRWFQWLHLAGKAHEGDHVRQRSEASSTSR